MSLEKPKIAVSGLCVLLAATISGGAAAAMSEDAASTRLPAALDAVRAEDGFRAPTWNVMQTARTTFRRLFSGDAESGSETFDRLGFATRSVALDTGNALAVSDPPGDVRGRGFYLLDRTASPEGNLLVQAPHRFKDLDTGKIVAALVQGGRFRAAAWNTVPRWAPDDRSDRSSDVAHIDVSFFNAFTLAFAEAYPDGAVVQVHGFAREHRDTAAGRDADVIVSSGTRQLREPAHRVHGCLNAALDGAVLAYGEDVFELGATTNRNAAALRRNGFDRFVHVELAREMRRRLLAEPVVQDRLRRCLLKAAR